MANTTGKKFGGRKKGTPNKKTQDLYDQIQAAVKEINGADGYDPVIQMAILATKEGVDDQLRFNCHKEIAPYIHAKRKAVEVSGDETKPVTLKIIGIETE